MRGWGKPGASRKYHYFLDSSHSLCDKWWWPLLRNPEEAKGALEEGRDDHGDNCMKCRYIKEARDTVSMRDAKK